VLVRSKAPHAGEQDAPPCVRVHVTPAFARSESTVAIKRVLVLTTALALPGETETEIGKDGAIVMAAGVDLVASAREVAVSVTATFAGTVGGGL